MERARQLALVLAKLKNAGPVGSANCCTIERALNANAYQRALARGDYRMRNRIAS
jgi:hypothetical protein